MARPSKLEGSVVEAWLKDNGAWARDGRDGHDGLARTFTFPDFASALAFAVRVGMLAEKRDHHPDLMVGWGKARVFWTTHDADGITQLDLDLAAGTDAIR
jgi:4a-hydroxytetrahydrobiopterin dehydratase